MSAAVIHTEGPFRRALAVMSTRTYQTAIWSILLMLFVVVFSPLGTRGAIADLPAIEDLQAAYEAISSSDSALAEAQTILRDAQAAVEAEQPALDAALNAVAEAEARLTTALLDVDIATSAVDDASALVATAELSAAAAQADATAAEETASAADSQASFGDQVSSEAEGDLAAGLAEDLAVLADGNSVASSATAASAAQIAALAVEDVDVAHELLATAEQAAVDAEAAVNAAAERLDAAETALTVAQLDYDVIAADRDLAQAAVDTAEAEVAAARSTFESMFDTLSAVPWRAGWIGPGLLIWPVDGEAGSRFGPREHPIHGGIRLHAGVDVGVPTGTPLYAAADGTVVHSGPRGGYGNTVEIDHPHLGVSTLYAHQSRLMVAEGEQVRAGQQIGEAGSTGQSTGPHLHFEVRVDGVPSDPMAYWDENADALTATFPSLAGNASIPPGLQPVAAAGALEVRRLGFGGGLIGVAPRPTNPDSSHPTGFAIDVMVHDDFATGDFIANYFVDNRNELRVRYVIWHDEIASAQSGWEWRPYVHPSGATDDTSAHRDHVHIDFIR